MFRFAFLSFMLAGVCFADSPVVIGVRGGARLNDIVDAVNNAPTTGQTFKAATENYVVGPSLGVRLPAGFSIVGDALFTRLNFDVNRSTGVAGVSANAAAWEFPVMVKWTLPAAVGPFVGAGVSVRHLSDFGDVGSFITGSNTPLFPQQNTVGFVIGGGISFKAGPLHIEPEIRWTRWNQRDVGTAFRNFFEVNRNQAQILVGLVF